MLLRTAFSGRTLWLAPRRALVAAVRWYQRTVSPLTPPSCRFVPTCSQYAAEALERYGVARGGLLALWRIGRCHPLGGRGWDPPRWFGEAPDLRYGEPPVPAPEWLHDGEATPAGRGTDPRGAG